MKESSSICISLKIFMTDTDDDEDESAKWIKCDGREALSARWYVLALYCMSSFSQVIIWNTWSPIANSALYAFPSWHESTIALLNNWSCIMFLIFITPCCWLLNEKGLRLSIILATFLCLMGSGVRLLSTDEQTFTMLAHTGAILNSIGGVMLSPSIVLLSSTWFPANQRTSATGIGTSLSLLGIAGSYLLGPNLVPEPPRDFDEEPSEKSRVVIRTTIFTLLTTGFLLELILFILILSTFPMEPKIPASKSTILRMAEEAPFFASVMSTVSNIEFWKLSLASGLSSGITGPWLSMLTLIFAQKGVTQTESATLGFWSVVCSCCMGLSVSKASDMCPGHIRTLLIVLFGFADFMFLWILLITTGIVEFSKGRLAIVVIGGLSVVWATPALFYEMGAELNYPIPEGIVAGCMMAINNFCACMVYLQLYIFPSVNVDWMNYGLVILGCLSLILLFTVKENYKRMVIDIG